MVRGRRALKPIFLALMAAAGLTALFAACAAESEIRSAPEAEPATVTAIVTETISETEAVTVTVPPSAQQEEAAAAEPSGLAGVGDAITLAGLDSALQVRVKMLEVVDPAPADAYFEPEKGDRYVAIRVSLVNVGEAVYDDCPSNGAVLVDREDQQWSTPAFSADVEPEFGCLKIAPGDRRVGWFTFQIPEKAKLRLFQFTLDSGFGPETGQWRLS